MLPNTLLKIEENTKMKQLSLPKKKKLSKILSFYEVGQILYPGIIIRHTGLDMINAYILLDEIESLQIIEKAYEVSCPKCHKYTGVIYHSLNDVPNNFNCEACEHEFTFPEGLLVVYRVILE